MRIFIGFGVSDEIRAQITKIQQKIADSGASIKLVELENLHFCLKFIGETSSNLIKIEKSLEKVAENTQIFNIHIAGIWVFPRFSRINVIWAGVGGGKENLINLAQKIEEELIEAGFRASDKEFKPHLTLGRVKSGKNREKLVEILQELEKSVIGDMEIDKISIYGSIITEKGPIYKKIFSVKLG